MKRSDWLKSSHSANNAQCVEVRFTVDAVGVRDSKHPSGPHLSFPRTTWTKFLTSRT